MATSLQTIEHLQSLYDGDREWNARKMFGEYGIYLDGKMVAMVCDDRLFVKILDTSTQVLGTHWEEDAPYPGAKPHAAPSDTFLNKRGNFTKLLEALWKVIPAPKPKAPKAPKPRKS